MQRRPGPRPPPRDMERLWPTPAYQPDQRRRWLAACEAILAVPPDQHPARREAAILAVQIPASCDDPLPGDRLAGRWTALPMGVSPEPGGFGLYADQARLEQLAASEPDAGMARRWRALAEAWPGGTSERAWAEQPAATLAALPPGPGGWAQPGAAFPLARLAGLQLDHRRLLAGGLPGLRRAVTERAARAGVDAEAATLCAAWLQVIDAYAACLRDLAGRARACPAAGEDRIRLDRMAIDCAQLAAAAPATFAQAVQLLWIWDACAGVLNHGRLDDDLALFLAPGADAEVEAVAILAELWRRIDERRSVVNGRIIIGGAGRRDPAGADRVALCCLAATAAHDAMEPQLSLRIDAAQDPRLLARALDCLALGRTFPILYWDASIVPDVAAAHGVGPDLAATWLPYGCGETVLGCAGTASPNGIINAARVLEEVLFGLPPGSRRPVCTDDLVRAPAFAGVEEVWQAFAVRVDAYLGALALWQVHSHRVAAADCRFLPASLLLDDCLGRGRAVLGGGIRRHGGTMELYGMVDAGDSFAALADAVFGGGMGLDALRRALLDDFQGHAAIQARLRRAPAYGNDEAAADAWVGRVHSLCCASCREHGRAAGLDHFLVVVINNWVNTVCGRRTGALPSGRRAGSPLANANNPQPGRDRAGPLALLRSLAGLDRGVDAGCVQHLKLAKTWFAGDRARLRALLDGYAAAGGKQLMITLSEPGELAEALREPERFAHLMVRVGGFSARFVDLPRDCQEEICARSCH